MPLEIQQYSRVDRRFKKVGEIRPGDRSKGFISLKANGNEEIVIFECAPDDSGSTVFRSKRYNIDEREIIKRLSKDESFGMAIVKNSSTLSINAEGSTLYNITHR